MASNRSLVGLSVCGLSALLAGLMPFDANADVRVSDETFYSITIEMTGEISEHDASKFADTSERLALKALVVHLDSKGGDVFAAMKIGRIIRAYDGWTWNDSVCYSSCALIFIAGVIRTNFYAEIGLHRPYLGSSPQPRETIEKQMPAMLARVKSYVDEMGVSNAFYEQMMRTEPSKMVVYRGDAIRKIVPEHDPIFDEVVIATMARTYGVTTSEMRRREEDAKRCSSNKSNEAPGNCREAIYWGLSERVYAEQYGKATKHCWFSETERFSDEETKTFWNTPIKKRLDLPFFVRLEDCTRSIMHSR